ncbi:hypothetical protein JKP88DRAFT_232464 [Tribonema minus]|uniref:Uncharacterized protein n=1 Tax=Tribonema minus TaxID=303371 RepID=A0A836CLU9_9STRA|nr:hypothetical protein JKP88DRAFT_232464 [Tribonema minus]
MTKQQAADSLTGCDVNSNWRSRPALNSEAPHGARIIDRSGLQQAVGAGAHAAGGRSRPVTWRKELEMVADPQRTSESTLILEQGMSDRGGNGGLRAAHCRLAVYRPAVQGAALSVDSLASPLTSVSSVAQHRLTSCLQMHRLTLLSSGPRTRQHTGRRTLGAAVAIMWYLQCILLDVA